MLCIEVCVCMSKQEYFLSRIWKRGQLVLTYMCIVHVCGYVWVLVCLSHLIYWSFKPTVGVLMYLSASDIFFHVYRIRVICGHLCVASECRLLYWTKKFWVLILSEWIEIRSFKFTRVVFISGQLKFKCTDVWVNTTCDLI